MRHVLASEKGGALYAKRQGMIEPVFADTARVGEVASTLSPSDFNGASPVGRLLTGAGG